MWYDSQPKTARCHANDYCKAMATRGVNVLVSESELCLVSNHLRHEVLVSIALETQGVKPAMVVVSISGFTTKCSLQK